MSCVNRLRRAGLRWGRGRRELGGPAPSRLGMKGFFLSQPPALPPSGVQSVKCIAVGDGRKCPPPLLPHLCQGLEMGRDGLDHFSGRAANSLEHMLFHFLRRTSQPQLLVRKLVTEMDLHLSVAPVAVLQHLVNYERSEAGNRRHRTHPPVARGRQCFRRSHVLPPLPTALHFPS